jgi:hypothetical protein
MANYTEQDGYVFNSQSNIGWGLTLKMTDKAPAVAKRIFDSYEHALYYVNDVNDTAIEGLLLSVISDSDETKNGAYFVKQVATPEIPGDEENGVESIPAKEAILVKVGSDGGEDCVKSLVLKDGNGNVKEYTPVDNIIDLSEILRYALTDTSIEVELNGGEY